MYSNESNNIPNTYPPSESNCHLTKLLYNYEYAITLLELPFIVVGQYHTLPITRSNQQYIEKSNHISLLYYEIKQHFLIIY